MKAEAEILAIPGGEGRRSQKSLQCSTRNDRSPNVFVASEIREMIETEPECNGKYMTFCGGGRGDGGFETLKSAAA